MCRDISDAVALLAAALGPAVGHQIIVARVPDGVKYS
jgi:hypothetical protein